MVFEAYLRMQKITRMAILSAVETNPEFPGALRRAIVMVNIQYIARHEFYFVFGN